MNNPITELEELKLTGAAKRFLSETASWTKFISILGFIGIGLMVIVSFFAGTIFNSVPQAQTMPFDFGYLMTGVYLVLALLYFFPVLYLFQFSKKMKEALQSKNDDVLATAFEKLKSHYKFIGVFTIIFISLYILMIVAAIVGGIAF
jgi:uncharacterized membrane protein